MLADCFSITETASVQLAITENRFEMALAVSYLYRCRICYYIQGSATRNTDDAVVVGRKMSWLRHKRSVFQIQNPNVPQSHSRHTTMGDLERAMGAVSLEDTPVWTGSDAASAVAATTTTVEEEDKVAALRRQLQALRQERLEVRRLRQREAATLAALEQELSIATREQQLALDDYDSLQRTLRRTQHQFQVAEQWHVLSDAFCIWYSGPFATINGMRLGSEGHGGNPTNLNPSSSSRSRRYSRTQNNNQSRCYQSLASYKDVEVLRDLKLAKLLEERTEPTRIPI